MSNESAPEFTLDLDQSALVIADRKGRIVYWSPGATALFGYAAEAMVGKGASVLVPPAYRRRHTAGFSEHLHIQVEPPRRPVFPGRCGAFWTTYEINGRSMDIAVTLYRNSSDVAPALAEPLYGPVHVFANGARIRTSGPSAGSIGGTPASSYGAVSAFRNLFISSTSISTRMTALPASAQLRIHRRIENDFARLH